MNHQTPIEPFKETKDALLRFLLEEKIKQEKSKSKFLKLFNGKLERFKGGLKDLLLKLDSNVLELERLITKVLQTQNISKLEEDPQLRMLNLDPQEAIEEMKNFIPSNSHINLKMLCSFNGEVGKMIAGLIEDKLESIFNNKFSTIEKVLADQWEFINSNKSQMEHLKSSINDIKKQIEQENDFHKRENKSRKVNKKPYNFAWNFMLSTIVLLLALFYLINSPENSESSEFNSTSTVESEELITTIISNNPAENSEFNSIVESEELTTTIISNNPPENPKSTVEFDELITAVTNNNPPENLEISEFNSTVESEELIAVIAHKTVFSINLKTLEKKQIFLPFDSPIIGGHVFIPIDDSIFFIGNLDKSDYIKKETFIIEANKRIKKIGSYRFHYGNPMLSYYDNYVYAFWDVHWAKYNYDWKLWESGSKPLLHRLSNPSHIGFKNHILIVDRDSSKLISYNITQNNFQEVPNLELLKDNLKIIFSADNRVYIVELSGRIYQSAVGDFTTWEMIGISYAHCDIPLYSHVVRYNGKFYFKCKDDSVAVCEFKKGQSTSVCRLRNFY